MKFNSERKRVLIIASSFPPSAAVGAKRFAFLSRILQKRYPELHVLTRKEKYMLAKDDSLSAGGFVHRTGMYPAYPIKKNNIFKKIFNRLWEDYLCLVEPHSGWILPTVVKGLQIIKDNKIDLIIATCPLCSSMVIGVLLSLMTKAKLILDYRDPWTNHNRTYCKIFGRRINEVFEKTSIRQASALVFCSRIMKDNLMDRLGKYTKATSYIVTNGFHNKDTIRPLSLGTARKNMVYSGNFYGERRIKLVARPLFHLLNEGSIMKDSFCFHVFGKLNAEDKEEINKHGLQDIVKERPRVPYEQITRYLKGADILFLPSGSDVSYAIPFKFFDYLSVKRPILAIAPENSAVAEMMNQIDCGRLALINSEESILKNLRTMLHEEKEYTFSHAQQYTWEEIGRKYLEVIDEVGKRN